jgi:hypothetical protein
MGPSAKKFPGKNWDLPHFWHGKNYRARKWVPLRRDRINISSGAVEQSGPVGGQRVQNPASAKVGRGKVE